MAKELWLFTISYPFGNGESYIESELPILARGFERVRVLPLLPEGRQRPLPPNAEVTILLNSDLYRTAGPLRVALDLRRWSHVLRVSKASAPDRGTYRRHRRELMSRVRQAMYRERVLRDRLERSYDPAHIVLYSYWTSDWATVLGLWKLDRPDVRFTARMMGFDLFDHRAPGGWQMLQAFHVEQAGRLVPISRAGLDHMLARFPGYRDKFMLGHLATMDHGAGPWAPADRLRIASCSNLYALKRVHLVIEALDRLRLPVKWTHFGDGPERAALEKLVRDLPPIIEVEFMGSRPNTEVMAWYKANPVDVFVHMSRTEGGAPVALQESASFGIPLIAANAGGVNEIVTPYTGILLPLESTGDDLAAMLHGFYHSGWRAAQTRETVRAFWRAHFHAEDVHGRLLAELLR